MNNEFELEEHFSDDDFYGSGGGDRRLKPDSSDWCSKRGEEIECPNCEFYNELDDKCEWNNPKLRSG